MKAKTERDKLIAERSKRAISEVNGNGSSDQAGSYNYKRLKAGTFPNGSRDADGRIAPNLAAAAEQTKKEQEQISTLKAQAAQMLGEGMVNATVSDYLAQYGDKALEYWDEDQKRAGAKREGGEEERQRNYKLMAAAGWKSIAEDTKLMLSQNRWTGRRGVGVGNRDGEGRFEDDFDNRLPR